MTYEELKAEAGRLRNLASSLRQSYNMADRHTFHELGQVREAERIALEAELTAHNARPDSENIIQDFLYFLWLQKAGFHISVGNDFQRKLIVRAESLGFTQDKK